MDDSPITAPVFSLRVGDATTEPGVCVQFRYFAAANQPAIETPWYELSIEQAEALVRDLQSSVDRSRRPTA